jgi:hypothetical protein
MNSTKQIIEYDEGYCIVAAAVQPNNSGFSETKACGVGLEPWLLSESS